MTSFENFCKSRRFFLSANFLIFIHLGIYHGFHTFEQVYFRIALEFFFDESLFFIKKEVLRKLCLSLCLENFK
ncbi:MAG TPA: hypothetical protein DIS75_07945 [Chryseobacterium sp.]|nr:hypothetical protein [Chryseobacterium sp.]